MWALVWTAVLWTTTTRGEPPSDPGSSPTICAYTYMDPQPFKTQSFTPSNATEVCEDTDVCYTYWFPSTTDNQTVNIRGQGCWDVSGEDCGGSQCVDQGPSKLLNNTKFCCCTGSLCNTVVLDNITALPLQPDYRHDLQPLRTSHFAILLLLAASGSLLAGYVVYLILWRRLKPPDPPNKPPDPSPTTILDTSSLKLEECIGRGRYGTVWRAILRDQAVAVKVYSSKNFFQNEQYIYSLAHMSHPSLTMFYGSEERIDAEGRPEYWLILSYAPGGNLQTYLRQHTVDWPTLCKMSQSIARGLAHLHTEIYAGDQVKPPVAHRDLTSCNILVKADNSCTLCDFGLAMRISGGRYYIHGEEQVAETCSLADAGTLRYMAPEVLEGAVNLRDCESALKQVDIYALALVLWELASRMSDIYPGEGVPEYKLPYEAELGLHPTFDQLQLLVTRNKARPLLPDIWKGPNIALRAFRDTLEECWDQDAEARLTALCVVERLTELLILWERQKGNSLDTAVSPTIKNVSDEKVLRLVSNVSLESSVAQSSTTETKSVRQPSLYNVRPSSYSVPLQPHQGCNPCMERNIFKVSSENVIIRGNHLIYQQSLPKNNLSHIKPQNFSSSTINESVQRKPINSNYHFSHSLRSSHSIPYLINSVQRKKSTMISKKPNVPGNGHPLLPSEEQHLNDLVNNVNIGNGMKSSLQKVLDSRWASEKSSTSEEHQPLQRTSHQEVCSSENMWVLVNGTVPKIDFFNGCLKHSNSHSIPNIPSKNFKYHSLSPYHSPQFYTPPSKEPLLSGQPTLCKETQTLHSQPYFKSFISISSSMDSLPDS